jgi:chemotaxis protein CheC
METRLSDTQLERFAVAMRMGANQASQAMATWLSAPSLVEFDSVDQLPVNDALDLLGDADQTLCFCSMEIAESMTGQIILAFDDQCGLSLSDLLLNRPVGTATEWGEVEVSAALETINIIGCAYLNSLTKYLAGAANDTFNLVPSPPTFRREFVESLLQAAFLGQATASDFIFVSRTMFQIRGKRLNWNMLFVPDAPSLGLLSKLMEQVD